MRARSVLAFLGSVAFAAAAPWACFSQPDTDFSDYQARVASFPKAEIEASTFEASAPPAQAVEGLFYGACLSELAFGQVSKVFNLLTQTKFTPGAGGGSLELSNRLLAVVNDQPPATVTAAGAVGDDIKVPSGPVGADGKFSLDLGTVTFPGVANPISGSDVVIEGTKLKGRFAGTKFCARLLGNVTEPAAAARSLDPDKNICQFVPIKDGDPTPKFTLADFQPGACPL
jgi:hypothetical protein